MLFSKHLITGFPMLVEKEIKKLFQQLLQDDVVHINVGRSDITVRVFDHASKLSLSTPVYEGGNFIPKSVRVASLSKVVPFARDDLKTYLSIDEQSYQVALNYLGRLENFHNDSFKDLLEGFSGLADDWRLFLDEHDKNDLVHVHVPH